MLLAPRAIVALALALVAAGCSDGGPSAEPGVDAGGIGSAEDAPSGGTDEADETPAGTAPDAGPATEHDATPGDDDDAGAAEDPDAPVFVVGVNVTGENQPEFFSELPEDGELNIELGPQGLWMVVLAFRTRNIFEGSLKIFTSIDVDGVEQGFLGLGKQKLHAGGDGYDYFYNLYLVVDDPTVAGQIGEVSLEVEGEDAGHVVETRTVLLTGGK